MADFPVSWTIPTSTWPSWLNALIVQIEREAYGCSLCQGQGKPYWHKKGDPLFPEHVLFQGKHSWHAWIEFRYFLVEGEGASRQLKELTFDDAEFLGLRNKTRKPWM